MCQMSLALALLRLSRVEGVATLIAFEERSTAASRDHMFESWRLSSVTRSQKTTPDLRLSRVLKLSVAYGSIGWLFLTDKTAYCLDIRPSSPF